jgi:ribosomal protein S18 acetylase RimI-like enzyme
MTARELARVRPAAAADRAGLLAILASDQTFQDDERAVALELIDAALNGSPDYLVRVAEAPAPSTGAAPTPALAGYVCFGPTPMTESTWDLYWIVVHAAARGQGVAQALVQAMEAELRQRGAKAVRVETSETEGYGAARKLYARLEYPVASMLADFYRPGDALITYYKRL